MLALDRLLGYLSAHRNGVKVIRPSSMILQVMSDASYLSRPQAGSVAGDFHHLGIPGDPSFVNAPISIASTRIPIVCSSVQEAEWFGTFGAARTAITERQTLTDHRPWLPPAADAHSCIATTKSLSASPTRPSRPSCPKLATCGCTG